MTEPREFSAATFLDQAIKELEAYGGLFDEIIQAGGPDAELFNGVKAVNDEKLETLRRQRAEMGKE